MTDGQQAAAVGTFGSPGATNAYVVDKDPRMEGAFPFSGASITKALNVSNMGLDSGEVVIEWNTDPHVDPPQQSDNITPGTSPNQGVFYDFGGWFNFAAPEKLTVPSGGLARILVELQTAVDQSAPASPPSDMNFYIYIEKNAGGYSSRITLDNPVKVGERTLLVTPPWEVLGGDFFRVVFGWRSGGTNTWSLFFNASETESRFSIEKIA
jgi:hypothetical protein